MTADLPPRVALPPAPLGLGRLFGTAHNIVGIVPQTALERPHLSGRTVWRWHLVSGAAELRHVLAERAEDYPRARVVDDLFRPAVRHSFFLAPPAVHAWQRRVVQPHFAQRASAELAPLFARAAAEEAERICPGGEAVLDLHAPMVAVTLRIIMAALFGPDTRIDGARFRREFERYASRTAQVQPLDILRLPPWASALWRRGEAGVIASLRAQILGEVARHRAAPAAAPPLVADMLAARDPASGRGMTADEICDTLLFLIIAGHETAANTLAWAGWLLATHPEAQDRARAEALATSALPPAERQRRLPWLSAVVDETMRLYPALPMLLRQAARPGRLSGCPVRRGDYVFVPLYAAHRMRGAWEAPDAFRPERFLDGREERAAFLPFSIGPRSCIGAAFSRIELRLVLAELLQRLHLAPAGAPPRPEAVLSLTPEGGVPVRVTRLAPPQTAKSSGSGGRENSDLA